MLGLRYPIPFFTYFPCSLNQGALVQLAASIIQALAPPVAIMVFAHALSGFGMSLQVRFYYRKRSSTFTQLLIQGCPSQRIRWKPEATCINEARYHVRIIWYIRNPLLNHNLTESFRTRLLYFPFGRNLFFKNSPMELLLSHLGGNGLLQHPCSHLCVPPQTTRW